MELYVMVNASLSIISLTASNCNLDTNEKVEAS